MKINFGVHLRTSSPAISIMEVGEPIEFLSNTLKESTPMSDFVNRRGDITITAHKIYKLNALKNLYSCNQNIFREVTRTPGSDLNGVKF